VRGVRRIRATEELPVLEVLVQWKHWWSSCFWEWVDIRSFSKEALVLVRAHLEAVGCSGNFSLDVPQVYPKQLPMGCVFSSLQAILGDNLLAFPHLKKLAKEQHDLDFMTGTMYEAHHQVGPKTVNASNGSLSLPLVKNWLNKCTNLNLFKMKDKSVMVSEHGRYLLCAMPKDAGEMQPNKKRKKKA
jgi:hypothetical protein